MPFTTERLERLERSLELPLNHEWPQLSATRKHFAKARPTQIRLPDLAKPLSAIATVATDGGEDSLSITGLLLWRIFQHNVRHLTDMANPTVRCLTVLEEAQTMLSERVLDDRNVFVHWVKEGRKYGLGCVLVTQQPSSISSQIISQGDNFFVLHLLNETDLQTLKKHNAYFSDEILGFIRGEPIPGNCYFWSAPSQPFVLPVRVRNFETVAAATASLAKVKPDLKRLGTLTSKVVQEALENSPRVWVYPVNSFHGKKETGLVAVSRDYLQEAVAERLMAAPEFKAMAEGERWLKEQLAGEIETILRRHQVRHGYAVLAGVARAVWVVPQGEIRLGKKKTLRPQSVEVLERI